MIKYLLIICAILFFVTALSAKKKKYEMTYGIIVPNTDVKSKTIALRKGTNILTVTPDVPSKVITCSFINENGEVVDEDIKVSKCLFENNIETTKTVIVKLRSCESHPVSVELNHVVK